MNRQQELFARGGLKDEGGMIDEESGNEVPVGGLRKGVRDDIDVNMSEGEFVFPEDVTRYIGLDKLMQMRQEAKMGLRRMEEMGQMGNSEEATLPDDMPFTLADLMVVDMGEDGKEKELDMAEGGVVPRYDNSAMIDLAPAQPMPDDTSSDNPYDDVMGSSGMTFKEYRNESGQTLMVPFVDDIALYPIPEGYKLYTGDGDDYPNDDVEDGKDTVSPEVPRGRSDDRTDVRAKAPDPIKWDELSDEEYIEQATKRMGAGRTIAKVIASLVNPLFGLLVGAATAAEDKKVLAGLQLRVGNIKDPTLVDTFQKQIEVYKAIDNGLLGGIISETIDAVGKLVGVKPEVIEEAKTVEDEVQGMNANISVPPLRPASFGNQTLVEEPAGVGTTDSSGLTGDPSVYDPAILLEEKVKEIKSVVEPVITKFTRLNTKGEQAVLTQPAIVSTTTAPGMGIPRVTPQTADDGYSPTPPITAPDQYDLAASESDRFNTQPTQLPTTSFNDALYDQIKDTTTPETTIDQRLDTIKDSDVFKLTEGDTTKDGYIDSLLPPTVDLEETNKFFNNDMLPPRADQQPDVFPDQVVNFPTDATNPVFESSDPRAGTYVPTAEQSTSQVFPVGETVGGGSASDYGESFTPSPVFDPTQVTADDGYTPVSPIDTTDDARATRTNLSLVDTTDDARATSTNTSQIPSVKSVEEKTPEVKIDTGIDLEATSTVGKYKEGQSNQATAWKNLSDANATKVAAEESKYAVTGGTAVNGYAVGAISDGTSQGVLADKDGFALRDTNNRVVFVDASGNNVVRTTVSEMLSGKGMYKPAGTFNKEEISIASTDASTTVTPERKNELSKTAKSKVGTDAGDGMVWAVVKDGQGNDTNVLGRVQVKDKDPAPVTVTKKKDKDPAPVVVTEKRDNSDRTDATQESPSAKAYKEAQESANSFTKSKVDSFTSTGRVSGGFAEGGLVKKRKPKKQVMKKKRGLATR